MPQIMILLIGILFLGCQTEISKVSPNTPPKLKPQIIEESTVQSIEGNYTLQEGRYSYSKNKAINKIISNANLVIEKLDDDDYGFYLTMQVEELVPTEAFGIFHKKDNKYFKRLIYSPDVTKDSNVSIASKKFQTELEEDEVKIIQKNNTLEINMKVGDGEATMIWIRDLAGSTYRSKELKDAEHEYIKTYKERFLNRFKDDVI